MLGAHALVLHACESARIVELEVLPTGSTLDRPPGALDRYLGPYRVTATSGPLPAALVDSTRAALRDPGSYVLRSDGSEPRGFTRRCLVLEAGERALCVGLLIDESLLAVGLAHPRGRGRAVLRLSARGRAALAPLTEVPLAPVGR